MGKKEIEDSDLINLKTEKLIPNLYDKEHYIVHYRNLKLYLQLGMRLKKVHKVLQFKQYPYLKEYIDFNTKKRQECKTDFEKDFFKLMNNSIFGKTCENIRNRTNIKIVKTEKEAEYYAKKPNFKRREFLINNKLGLVELGINEIKYNKPIMVGFSVLELSKVLMYDFHYNVMKKRYGDKIKLLFTDTDSLCYHIETKDFYKDMIEMKDYFDFSNFDKNHKCFNGLNDNEIEQIIQKNKKVIGKFKDECGGIPPLEFVGLRSKMYSIKLNENDEKKHVKELKGVFYKIK